MRAAVLRRPGDLQVEDRAWPEARPGWVIIAVEAAGICGTDIAVFRGRHPAHLPVVLGHEFSGRVVEVGPGVQGLEPGQRVMAEGSWPVPAANGNSQPREALGRTLDGCFAHAVAVPAHAVHSLPQDLSPRVAQSATTLATALHAVQRAGEVRQRRLAIIGPGHAGLLLLQACRLYRPESILMLGTRDFRLKLASRLGATFVVNVAEPAARDHLAEPDHREFDIVFEASGTSAGLTMAFDLSRNGGTVVCYGIIDQLLEGVPGHPLYAKELSVLGSKGAGDRYGEAIRLLAAGQVDVQSLVTHVLALEAAPAAFALAIERSASALRVVLTPESSTTS